MPERASPAVVRWCEASGWLRLTPRHDATGRVMSKSGEGKLGTSWSGLEEDEPIEDRFCVACRKLAPAESSALTLISSKHGWRLLRTRYEDRVEVEWLCPPCWATRREQPSKPRSVSAGLRGGSRAPGQSDPAFNVGGLHDMRATGAVDMISSVCRSLVTKLRTRVRPCPTRSRLLRAALELEAEIETWSEVNGTPERRTEVWSTIVLLNGQADELLSSQK